jgi:acetylornithine deacetylase/succinyl-diaminopimelate desuccinylase-like protein
MLAHLVASMRDEDGRVHVAGFYDDVEPLSVSEKRAIAAMPEVETELKRELLLVRTEGSGKRLDELIALPALNIQGIASASVGSQSRNVVPATATASIGIRLVKGMNHRRAVDKVIEHIRRQGYHVVESEPDEATRLRYPKVCLIRRRGGYNAVRAPMDSAIAQKVIQAVRAARGDVVLIPTAGGSLPIAPIEETLRKPVIMVPIANHDNNQHGHNENIRIQNLWDGIETMAALLTIG